MSNSRARTEAPLAGGTRKKDLRALPQHGEADRRPCELGGQGSASSRGAFLTLRCSHGDEGSGGHARRSPHPCLPQFRLPEQL